MGLSQKMIQGRQQWVATCGKWGCKWSDTGMDKRSVKRQLSEHIKGHRNKSREVTQAKRDIGKYGGRTSRIKESMTQAEIRQEVAKAKNDFQDRARKAEDAIGPVNRARGTRTKGIPGVPDGQKLTGLVYDEDGKRVPWHVITKYMNVD